MDEATAILFRPVGPKELVMIEEFGGATFPPRLPEQPYFYPVTNRDYAEQIPRDWNMKASGAGFVTRFAVPSSFLARYQVQQVGGSLHTELWVPAEELDEFNENIVGKTEVVAGFGVGDIS
jgi:hypothetical protein